MIKELRIKKVVSRFVRNLFLCGFRSTQNGNNIYLQQGFSVLEVLLAATMFIVFSSAAVSVVLQAYNANRYGLEYTIANQFAAEGLEAVRSIRNQNFSTVDGLNSSYCSSGAGVQLSGGVWAFKAAGTSDTLPSDSRFTRVITVCNAQKSGAINSDIVSSGGLTYDNVKKVTSTVTWKFKASQSSSNTMSQTTYLTNWRGAKGGLLAYANTTTGSNAILYKTFNANTNTWSSASTLFPDGTTTSTQAVQVIRMYASATRNEKIILSRHSTNNTSYIYASVFNESTNTWTKQQLTTWAASSVNNYLNFDGGYLANGDFAAVYSNNTSTPQMAVWNGTSWTTGIALNALSAIPNWIVARVRPGSNDMMAAFLEAGSGKAVYTETQFFNNSSGYATASWTLDSQHSKAGINATTQYLDFAWSPADPTVGALTYTNSSNDKNDKVQIVKITTGTADTDSWGSTGNSSIQTNSIGALSITARTTEQTAGLPEFQACDKDTGTTPQILCYTVTTGSPVSSAPSFSTVTTISTATDTGTQRSYALKFENVTGDSALIVYSDNTSAPKFKLFNVGSANAWDASPSTVSMGSFTPGTIKTVRIAQQDQGDDMLVLIADANLDVYSIFYDGTTNALYSTPASMAIQQQGLNGVSTANFWYDFAWDKF